MRGFKQKRYKDFISLLERKEEVLEETMRELLNGRMLVDTVLRKNLGFVLLLTVLGIFYIWIGYNAEKLFMKKVRIEKELNELRFESITTASELMKISTQSEVLKRIRKEGLNLEESKEPPVRIEH